MKTCVKCGSHEIVKNLGTCKIYCLDCKSEEVYRTCNECNEDIKETPFDGSSGWHDNNVGKYMYGKTPASCWQYKKWNDEFDEDYS